MKHGLWIDDHPKRATRGAYVGALSDIGVNVAAVFVDSFHAGFKPLWSVEHLKTFRDHCEREGIERVLSLPPEPATAYIKDMAERLPAMVAALKPTRIEVDLEGQWKRSKVRGYKDLHAAGTALVQALPRLPLELTTFPSHAEADHRRATVAGAAHSIALQVYSVRDFAGHEIPWEGSRLSPGRYQTDELEELRGDFPSAKPVAGLAAYDQQWPGQEPHDAMVRSYGAAVAVSDVEEVRWWSSKWVVGARRNDYAADVIRELTGRDTAAPPPVGADLNPPLKQAPDVVRARALAAELVDVLS